MEPIMMLVCMILGGSLNLIFKNTNSSLMLAKVFFFISGLLVLNAATLCFSVAANYPVLADADRYCTLMWRVLLGYLVVYISGDGFMDLYTSVHPDKNTIFLNTIKGLSILIAGTFLISVIKSPDHFKEMKHVFIVSGYTAGILWLVILIKIIGCMGILLHARFKMGLPAASCLLLIIIGTIYTHWHNYDPFSDSFAAVAQLFNILIIAFLYYKEGQFKQMKHPMHALPTPMPVKHA